MKFIKIESWFVRSIIACLLAASFFSCEKEVEFNSKIISPKMVVNCIFGADSLFSVEVATSRSIPGRNNQFTWPSDAIVTLFVDDAKAETLVFDSIFVPFDNYNQYYYNEEEPTLQAKYVYKSLSTRGEVGRKYRIEVEHPVYGKASGESVIPEAVPIIKLDTITVSQQFEWGTETNYQLLLTFADPAPRKNYYRVAVKTFSGWEEKNKDGEDVVFVTNPSYMSYYYIDDNLIDPDENTDDLLFGSPSNRFMLISDELISGKEHTIKIKDNSYHYQSGKNSFTFHTFELYSLSEEAYLYLKSVTAHQYYDDGVLSEPVQVFTNLDNKLGIFASYSLSTVSLLRGQYPVEGVKYENYPYYYGY